MLILRAVLLDGKSSELFPTRQRVALDCTLLPTLLSIHINNVFCEIENCPKVAVKVCKNKLSCHASTQFRRSN